MTLRSMVIGGVVAAAFLGPGPLQGQQSFEMEWVLGNIRPSGQPVLPLFEGWFQRADGTYDLCFGYYNLNREQALDIPVGPQNFIEPSRFNGAQPTHFLPNATHIFCAFTVNVPSDIGTERIWWNLVIDGQTFRVPAHISSKAYKVDNVASSFPAMIEEEVQVATGAAEPQVLAAESLRRQGTPGMAPVLDFIEPAGGTAIGKAGLRVGPVTTAVGASLPLVVSLAHPESGGELINGSARWAKFSGPEGTNVTFGPERLTFRSGQTAELRTEATFGEPGQYVVFVQAVQGSFGNLCCWTTGYVTVNVTP